MYDMADLMGVKIRGDNLENFLNTWDMVVMGMRSEATEEWMRVLFLENIRKCGFLRVELAHFDRFELSHPQRKTTHGSETCAASTWSDSDLNLTVWQHDGHLPETWVSQLSQRRKRGLAKIHHSNCRSSLSSSSGS